MRNISLQTGLHLVRVALLATIAAAVVTGVSIILYMRSMPEGAMSPEQVILVESAFVCPVIAIELIVYLVLRIKARKKSNKDSQEP